MIIKGRVSDVVLNYGDELIHKWIAYDQNYWKIINVDANKMRICAKCYFTDDSHTFYKDDLVTIYDTIKKQEAESIKKTPFHLLDFDFAAAMCENWQDGIKNGRKPNDWRELKFTQDNIDKYEGAIMRHLREAKRATLSEDRRKHLAAIACNADILWNMEGK